MSDWSASTWWWVVTGLLVAVELATGTFYLLMLALGAAAAAVAAHAGAGLAMQFVVGAVVGGGAVALWRRKRGSVTAVPVSENRDVNLDVGERVHVPQWNDDGTARVQYRGASWQARHAGGAPMQPGAHLIRAVQGSELLLERAAV